jgi:pimeloyl-ACP methyl ester carboxylesterase
MSGVRRVVLTSFVAVITSLCLAVPTTASAHPHDGDGDHGRGHHRDRVDVDRVDFPVTLSDGHQYSVAGWLYHEGPIQKHRVLQVAVHGATYDHHYWDIDDLNGADYSYARWMARQGYAVLAIDQIGTGASGRPDGDFLSLDETASALHQVLVRLRTRHNPIGRGFQSIALVGHSNGALTSVYETGTYHDADVVVSTAWQHSPHPLPFDPAAILGLMTTPYLPARTFPEPFIAATFYHLPSTDPAMVHYDFTNLQADQSRRQFLDLLGTSLNPSLSRSTQISERILVQFGDFDALAPAAYGGPEATYYPNARLTIQNLSDIGHDVNAHVNHMQSWRGIDRWLEQNLGRCRDD